MPPRERQCLAPGGVPRNDSLATLGPTETRPDDHTQRLLSSPYRLSGCDRRYWDSAWQWIAEHRSPRNQR